MENQLYLNDYWPVYWPVETGMTTRPSPGGIGWNNKSEQASRICSSPDWLIRINLLLYGTAVVPLINIQPTLVFASFLRRSCR